MNKSRTLAPELLLNHKVGCATPCAPQDDNSETAHRGLTRPTAPRPGPALLLTFAIIGVSLLLLCPSSALAQGGVPLWTNRYDGPESLEDGASAIAVDSSGNVFVTGTSFGINSSLSEYATIKYSSAGVPLWTNRYNGPANNARATAIALDSSGNAFVTGYSWDAMNGGVQDYATIKYSSAGDPLWINYGPGKGEGAAIALDNNGNVFVTGMSDNHWATIKYSNAGDLLWTSRYAGPGKASDVSTAFAVDGNGNVFVTGEVARNTTWPWNFDFATVKYSNAGLPLWTNLYNGPGNKEDNAGRAIVVDSSGNVFVTGSSVGIDSYDYATIKYSSAGVPLWTNLYNGPAKNRDYPAAIALDSSGNVFVTGWSEDDAIDFSGAWATIKYSNSGVPLWTNRYNGPGNGLDAARAMALDSSGNVFVTGSSGTNFDLATVAYSNAGIPLWTNLHTGPFGSAGIAVDSSGNVFVTGTSDHATTAADYVTIKYSSSIPPLAHLDFQLLNNQLVLSWTNAGFNLHSAPFVIGPFTNLPAATSPYTNLLTAPQQFFRLISN